MSIIKIKQSNIEITSIEISLPLILREEKSHEISALLM